MLTPARSVSISMTYAKTLALLDSLWSDKWISSSVKLIALRGSLQMLRPLPIALSLSTG